MRDSTRQRQSLQDQGDVKRAPSKQCAALRCDGIRRPIGFRLMFALVAGTAMSLSYATLAAAPQTPAGSAAAAAATPVSCRDQLMLDRRDNPQKALKIFHQCNAVRNVAINMEYFTFWYVTLPAESPSRKDWRFEKTWKNNLAILTSRAVDIERESAINLLDDSIVRGLKRGRREDLIESWLSHHKADILAAAQPAPAESKAKPADPIVTPVSMPAPTRPPAPARDTARPAGANVAPVSMMGPSPTPASPERTGNAVEPTKPQRAAAPPPAQRPDRNVRRVPRRYAQPRPADGYYYRPLDAESDALNRAQAGAGWYGAAANPAGPYGPQPYYPPPVPPVEPSVRAAAPPPAAPYAAQPYYPPPPAQPIEQPVRAAAPPPAAPQAAQPYYPPPPQPVEQPVQPAGQVPVFVYGPQLIGQQIERNVRTISQLIEDNFRTFEQAVIKPTFFPQAGSSR